MIVKQREKSILIKKQEALLRRLPKNHSKYSEIEGDLAKRLAGLNGEYSMDYYLNEVEGRDYYIVNDLRLYYQDQYFQIDSLIIFNSFLLILESKNISGVVKFDPHFQQVIRINNGREEVFPDPVLQAKRYARLLSLWMKDKKLPELQIEYYIVITNPRAVLQTLSSSEKYIDKILRASNLPDKIQSLRSLYTKKIQLSSLKRVSKELLNAHVPLDTDLLSQYSIKKEELKKGVICPKCSAVPMHRTCRTWVCRSCQFKSLDEHVEAIKDYGLLFSTNLTNNKLRAFLEIQSPKLAYRLIKQLKVPQNGENKGRIYDVSKLV
ncbi:nuclease-related domain-containing protein [Bacillus sp. SJS]|uniref:nuclease-related domain-containing protein n=1 Tax=Bacillus sp. SJS TaxID=1423321 RepID=UPI0004DD10FD|nr:nuclease-related domain-containing protein [Bacillus sp. SJS]KZZ82601.1 hypothetical protein AS29_020560 [Bacillus sp. SJS]